LPAGAEWFTATVTDLPRNDTSEFSPGIAPGPPGQIAFTAGTYSVTENAVDAAIQVQRVGGSSGTLTATVSTLPGTALAGSDYTATTATVNFANGDAATKNVLVPIISDAVNETAETFTVALSGPTGSTGSPNTATVTIVDDDPLPLLSIDDIVVLEGDSGVSLSGISSQTITVGYATADGSASLLPTTPPHRER
jgi:hypothetical protein